MIVIPIHAKITALVMTVSTNIFALVRVDMEEGIVKGVSSIFTLSDFMFLFSIMNLNSLLNIIQVRWESLLFISVSLLMLLNTAI